MNLTFKFTETQVDAVLSQCNLGSGNIQGNGRISDYLKEGPFTADVTVGNLQLQEIIPPSSLPVMVQGNMVGQFSIQGKSLDSSAILTSMEGGGVLKVNDGRLVDINALRLFLNSISIIPDLVEKIENNLPEKYKEILKNKDTAFENIDFEIRIQDGRINLTRADIVADSFMVNGKGYYNFDQRIYVEGGLSIPKELSASMVSAVPELSPLLNQNEEIYIPIAPYEGPLNKIKIFPDIVYLTKRIAVGHGRQELQNLIDKALGTEESPQQDQNQAPQEKSIEKEIIENILDNIFGQ